MSSTISTDNLTDKENAGGIDPSIEAKLRALRTLLLSDENEQRTTLEYLKNALDEDRASERKLFQ